MSHKENIQTNYQSNVKSLIDFPLITQPLRMQQRPAIKEICYQSNVKYPKQLFFSINDIDNRFIWKMAVVVRFNA